MKTIVMFYNKALVDTPVDTWAEMKEFAAEFNDRRRTNSHASGRPSSPTMPMASSAATVTTSSGPRMTTPTSSAGTALRRPEGLAFYKTLQEDVYPVASADATWDAMNTMFSSGAAPTSSPAPGP